MHYGTATFQMIFQEMDVGALPTSQGTSSPRPVRILLMVQENPGRLDTCHSILVSDFEGGTRPLGGRLLLEDGLCAQTAASRLLFEQAEIYVLTLFLQVALKSFVLLEAEGPHQVWVV